MTTALAKYEAARAALAAAHRVDEVKSIRDKAQAMAAYAKQARDTQMVQWATEIKVRAERRCGEMLRDSASSGERAQRGRPANSDTTTRLSDLGLTRKQSERFQKLADMPVGLAHRRRPPLAARRRSRWPAARARLVRPEART